MNWRVWVIGRNPKRTLLRALIIAVLCSGLFRYVVRPVRVSGDSMDPTVRSGHLSFVNRLAYARTEPERGDIVCVRLAGESIMYLKRVIALPGEKAEIRSGRVYIDDTELREPYLAETGAWNYGPRELNDHQYPCDRGQPEHAD